MTEPTSAQAHLGTRPAPASTHHAFMDLPKLNVGKRFTLPRPAGSSDALLLAQLGQREKAAGKPMPVVTSAAAAAPRL
ncbi:MAG: hypothetical protein CFE44_20580, partial [Burkholderiales bacterium PBB4]